MTNRNATNRRRIALLGALGVVMPLGVFAMAEKPPAADPMLVEQGITIAETRMGTVQGAPVDVMGQRRDCFGPGLDVAVTSAGMEKRWLYDSNGEPCNEAMMLFDGATPLGQRAADPAVQIGFLDALGGLPRADTLPALPRIVVNSELIGTEALAKNGQPVGAPQQDVTDSLTSTLRQWQQGQGDLENQAASDAVMADAEATQAGLRDLDRQVQNTAGAKGKVAAVAAALREKERELAAAEARAKASRANSQQQRALTEAALTKAQQTEQATRAQLQVAKDRLAQLEAQNQKLAATKAQQEKLYQERIATMGQDLKVAETKANHSRQELIAQAAAKIAEAEALANAARVAEADAKAREAARLKQEAETMLARAMDLANNKAVIASGLENATPKAAPMALLEVPVVVHATNQTLPDLLASIMQQAAPQAGAWKADFQLTTANSFILSEKWSLTAEAPVKAVLDNLTEQIAAAHKVRLVFTQFPQSRLVVVTDQ